MESTTTLNARRGLLAGFLILLAITIIAAIATPNLLRSRMAVSPASNSLQQYSAQAELAKGADRAFGDASIANTRMVIRSNNLSLIADDPAGVLEKIRGLAQRLGGYVENSTLSENKGSQPSGSITIRVPATRLDEARAEFRRYGQRVENESAQANDVTAQYVDMDSRLRNYRAEEAQYLEIMRRSGTIRDTLSVAERLSDVRGRIEQLQGQLNLLSHQVQMASLTVSVRPEPLAPVTDLRWRPLHEANVAFHDGLDTLTGYVNFMMAVLFQLPAILLWCLTLAAFAAATWRLLRWLWRHLFLPPVRQAAA